MPIDQYQALADEYYRDLHQAELRATIMNFSGHCKRTVTAKELLGDRDPAPPNSNRALQDVLRLMGGKPKRA